MPRKAKTAPIVCEYFTWHLFRRGRIFYADGRSNNPSAGKHPLATRDRTEALERLRELDHQRAVEFGRAAPKVAAGDTLPDNRYTARGTEAGAARTTKGGRTRRVPMHATLAVELQGLSRRTDGLVFSGLRGGRAKPDTVRAIFIRDVIEPLTQRFPTTDGDVGFVHGRLHSFRHDVISQAFLSGVSEGEIRSWVGHRDSRIIEPYRHPLNDEAQRKIRDIAFFPAPQRRPRRGVDTRA
mgnify:FL=1